MADGWSRGRVQNRLFYGVSGIEIRERVFDEGTEEPKWYTDLWKGLSRDLGQRDILRKPKHKQTQCGQRQIATAKLLR